MRLNSHFVPYNIVCNVGVIKIHHIVNMPIIW